MDKFKKFQQYANPNKSITKKKKRKNIFRNPTKANTQCFQNIEHNSFN